MAKLSICIPTYTRARCLAELLDSIIAQEEPGVEIVVSDDASRDNTLAVLEDYQARMPNLKILRQNPNIGLDKNFLAVVAAASGDHAWLMGDDDRLEPGAIGKILAALDRWPGIAGMTVGVIDYAPDFSAVTGIREMPPTRLLSGNKEVFGEIGDLLGFMSGMVVNRRLWQEVCAQEPIADFFNLYIHVYIAGKMLDREPKWGVLNSPCVGYRSDNDQFLSKMGWLKRLKVDVMGYDQMARGIFANDPQAARVFVRRIFSTHIRARIVNAKTGAEATPDTGEAIRLLYRYYKWMPAFWYFALPLLMTPNGLLRLARGAYQKYSRSSGKHRARHAD